MNRVIKNDKAIEVDEATRVNLAAFARGERTWAEVEGMTFEEARAIAQVGCDLATAGRLEEARVIFEGLIAGNPKDSAVQAALGTVYQKLGRIPEARTAYDAAVESDPRNPVALSNRGELRLKSGDTQGFADLARAVESDLDGNTSASRRARGLIKAMAIHTAELLQAEQNQK